MLILLFGWHFLADYPLQGDFLARAKNRINPIAGVPFWQALTAHAFIHAAGVFVVTQSVGCASIEFISHWIIDDMKCRGKINFNQDQFAHILLKVGYVIYLAYN